MKTTRIVMLGALAALSTLGCSKGGSSGGGAASSAATAATTPASSTQTTTTASSTPSSSSTTPTLTAAPVWTYPGASTAPAASASSSAVTGPSSTAPSSATAGTPPTPPPATTPSTGVVLSGTIPPDPNTSFTGLLFLVGQRIVPGSSIAITHQGATAAIVPAVFFSSEVVGIDVAFVVAGDYGFTAVAPDGTTSAPLTVTIATATTPVTTFAAPDVHMIWPPATDTQFAGTVWIMGEHFLPGATLVGSGPLGPFVAPLVFMNERTLGWATATPLAGTYSLQVMNPTFQTSTPVTITVGTPSAPAGTLPKPSLVYTTSSVAAPFFGCLRIFGKDFLPGAYVELEDKASGAITTTPLVFVSSGEVWWMLVYPQPGDYQATLYNPDGKSAGGWSFTVN